MDKLPPELTTVTTTSKMLAFAVVIMLPFIGFYLGWQYGMETPETPNEQLDMIPLPDPNSTDEPPEIIDIVDPIPPRDQEPVVPPAIPDAVSSCGVTNCHGMEVTCGDVSDGGLMCTMEYRLGDFCRQYVDCSVVDGMCQPVKDPRYETCVSCVETCLSDAKDPSDAFSCEESCRTE